MLCVCCVCVVCVRVCVWCVGEWSLYFVHLPMKMELTVSSETSAIRTQTLGNYPKRKKLHLEHSESLKTRKMVISLKTLWQGLVLMMYLKDNQYWCASSRCVLYSSKELSAAIHTVKHNYITSIIVTMRVLTTTCFGLHVGHLQVVIRLYQLYYNAGNNLLSRGVGGYHGTVL